MYLHGTSTRNAASIRSGSHIVTDCSRLPLFLISSPWWPRKDGQDSCTAGCWPTSPCTRRIKRFFPSRTSHQDGCTGCDCAIHSRRRVPCAAAKRFPAGQGTAHPQSRRLRPRSSDRRCKTWTVGDVLLNCLRLPHEQKWECGHVCEVEMMFCWRWQWTHTFTFLT